MSTDGCSHIVLLGALALGLPARAAAQAVYQDPWQSLEARVLSDRIVAHTLPNEAEETVFEVSIRTTSFGREGAALPLAAGRLQAESERASILRGGIEEWLKIHEQGFEHGWTIACPPAAGGAPLWIGLEFAGLAPRISEDGLLVRLGDARGRTRLWYRHLSAHDADQKPLSARIVTSDAGIGIRVRDEGARYPITVDPILSSTLWAYESNQAGAQLGVCDTAGDINGDGYSDVIVGAPLMDNGLADVGMVHIFLGSASGPPLVPSWSSPGPNQAGANFGSSVCSVGDMNGDGYDDFAVGAPNFTAQHVAEGAVYIYIGGPSLPPTLRWTILGGVANLQLSYVFHAGDVNDDGFKDVLVSSTSTTVNGAVRLYLGSASPVLPSPFWAPTPASLGVPAAEFRNIHVAGVGDVNRDGFDDVMIGLPDANGGDGRALLFRGGGTSPLVGTGWTPSGPVGAGGGFGAPVRPAGDINGDGYADVYVGAPATLGGQGRFFIYLSDLASHPATWLPSVADQSVPGGTATSALGGGTGSIFAGDADGDGFADMLVGEPGYLATGRVRLYLGSPTGFALGAPEFRIGSPGMGLGKFTGTAGDVTGDGFNEAVMGGITWDNPQIDEGIVMLCEGFVTGSVLNAPDAGASTISGAATSHFASALSLSGDGNGDGFHDLLVGAPDTNNGQVGEGQVRLYLGGLLPSSEAGLATSPSWSYEPNLAGARLGAAVAWAGDVNGDGRSDVLVGAPGTTNGESGEGRVSLFLGTASGILSASPDWTFESNEANAELGTAVASAGDVDGDGLADIVVGAPGTHLGTADRGAVYVFRGRRTAPGLPATPDLTLDGPAGATRFGAGVAGLFDVNRDGYSDVVVGSPEYTNGQAGEGQVQLFAGSASGLSSSASWSYEPNSANTDFGLAIANAGDVNGDGRGDLVVGAPTYDSAVNGGAVYMFLASTMSTGFLAPTQLTIGQANAHYGSSVSFAGDVDDDGYSDVAIGAAQYDDGLTDNGKVWVHLGSSGGLTLLSAQSVSGSAANENCGSALAGAGDTDGDGFSDFVIGSSGWTSGAGRIQVYDGGASSGPIHGVQQRRAYDASAISLLGLSDSNQSFMLSSSIKSYSGISGSVAGTAEVKLEWELKALANPLDGTLLAKSASASDPVLVSSITDLVTTLQDDFDYVWRLRITTNDPFYPESPWQLMQGNGTKERKFSTGADCNANNVPDALDIWNATSTDLDENQVPDECQIQFAYCSPVSSSVSDCPCSNQPTLAGHGCNNTLLTGGASISGSGTPSVAGDALVITASSIGSAGVTCTGSVTNLTSILLQGPTLSSAGLVFGEGVRCFAGSLKRLNTATSSGGTYTFGPGVAARSALLGDPLAGGLIRYYLVYYRDSCLGSCASNFNASNGWRVAWQP